MTELLPEEEGVDLEASSSPESILDALREARDETATHHETFINIDGYEKSGIELLARYSLVSGRELEQIGKWFPQGKRLRTWEVGLAMAMDVMAHACTGIFIRRPEDSEPIPLTVGGEEIVNYGDPKLKTALKLADGLTTTRQIILGVFCDNELSIVGHSAKLQRWFGNTNANVDDDFLGEV
jgi:hypothetical protein